MVTPAVGAVVLVRFPFSDLTASKLRPAIVLADAQRGDWVLCQVTSQKYADPSAIEISNADFASGSLRTSSYARPAKLFTAHSSVIVKSVGDLREEKLNETLRAVIAIFEMNVTD